MSVLAPPNAAPAGLEPTLAPSVLDKLQVQGQDVDISALASQLAGSRLNGQCTLEFKSGCTYEGAVRDSALEGPGKIVFKDGLSYEGTFECNALQGNGTYRWPGGATYTGSVCGGLRHGEGRMSFADTPVVYEGSWHRGLRHGQGRITFNKEQTHWYQGCWEHDKKAGEGVMHYSNGDEYKGSWTNDVKSGYGVMEWRSRKQRYEGHWENNLPHGPGTHVWYQQLLTEPSPANHAMLMQFNRYEGHFQRGKRHGYGVLHYATGARYEGMWECDLKEGQGVYVFENGEVWEGTFHNDQPVLTEGEVFAPKSPGVCMQIEDLLSEEEVAAAASRGVSNVLMVYNTELRGLYDKYCKRPSLHLRGRARPGFTMVTCQVWELLSDVRLVTAATPLARCDELMARARRPPTTLDAFRRRTHAAAGDSIDAAWWRALVKDHERDGVHAPMQELLFREFCELLVRLAAVRYRHLPQLERRLHTLINVHLLQQVSRAKAPLPPPPRTPFHVELWSGTATSLLHSCDPLLRQAWAQIATETGTPETATVAAVAEDGSETETCGCEGSLCDVCVYGGVRTVRQAVRLLQRLGLLGSSPAEAMQAAAAFTHNYLTVNTYTYEPQRLRVEMEGMRDPDSAAEPTPGDSTTDATPISTLSESDVCEVLCWLDQPLLYADWFEGLTRLAHTRTQQAPTHPTTHTPHQANADVPLPELTTTSSEMVGAGVESVGSSGPETVGNGEGALHRQLHELLLGAGGLQERLKVVEQGGVGEEEADGGAGAEEPVSSQ